MQLHTSHNTSVFLDEIDCESTELPGDNDSEVYHAVRGFPVYTRVTNLVKPYVMAGSRKSYRMITTGLAMLVFWLGLLAAGCGGDSPTQPTPITPSPPPPPAPTVSVVEVSPSMATVEVGRTQRFVATAKASDGTVISEVDFAWSSSNTAVVTINNNGVATAVAAGTATIRATGNGVSSAAVTITVTVAAVVNVTVSPSSTQELMVGETVTFLATARTAGGAVRGDVSFTWASSDTSVVSITSAGVATAVSAGTAMVRATADGITSSPVTINVAEPPPPEPVVANVTVSPSEAMIETDATQQFAAKALTSDGPEIPDAEFTWSSSDEMVASVDADGLATGVGAGEAMITATADSVSGTATLTVTDPPPPEPVVAIVTVSPPSMMIMVEGMFRFTAVAMTIDSMVVEDVDFTWMSDDTEVATVDETGLVTAVAAGTAMITATGNDVTSMPATVTVEESPPVIDSVEIVDAMPVMLELGDTHQLMAVARTSDGTMIGGVTLAWSSDDNDVATVDSTGLVSAVGAGMAEITARTEETTSEPVTVTVAEPPPVVDRVTVSPSTASIEEGETRRFTARAYASDNQVIPGKSFMWTSSRTSVATISSSGLARARNAGSTTITATVDDVSGTAMLTVTEPPPVVDRVSVSPSSASIEEGKTQRFTASAYTLDNEIISGKNFRWTSSRTSVATISSSGLARGRNAGSTTIRASVDGKSDTAMLTVTEPPPVVDRVTVSPSTASIEEGETRRFTARAFDSDNVRITGKTFTWTSSNTTVATVSPSSGTATTARGVNAGSTTIRASVDGKNGTARLTVTAPPPPPPPPPPMLRSRTGTISGRNGYSSGGSVTLSETSDGKLRLSITGLSTPGGAPDVYVALYTSSNINWPNSGSLPTGAKGFGEVSRQSGNKSWTFTPASGKNINSWSHLILHCRLINREVGSASLSN